MYFLGFFGALFFDVGLDDSGGGGPAVADVLLAAVEAVSAALVPLLPLAAVEGWQGALNDLLYPDAAEEEVQPEVVEEAVQTEAEEEVVHKTLGDQQVLLAVVQKQPFSLLASYPLKKILRSEFWWPFL